MVVKSTSKIGAAAVHIVCADLLLHGHGAALATEGSHYDLIADVTGQLIRIQVKSSSKPYCRPNRGVISAYQFTSARNHRPDRLGEKSRIKLYSSADIDMMALVALDIRTVAYFLVSGKFIGAMWLYPAGTPPFIRNGREQRRCIDQFPFAAAISGYTGKPTLGWL